MDGLPFPSSNLIGRRGRFSTLHKCIYYGIKTEWEAARLLPLLATASAVHNFCRHSDFTLILYTKAQKSQYVGSKVYAKYHNKKIKQ